jgi:hypothetical protein
MKARTTTIALLNKGNLIMKLIQKSLLALALVGTITSANATLVDWTFTNTTLSFSGMSGSITGSFTYDADTNSYSNFYAVSSFGGDFRSFTQNDSDSFTLGGGSASPYILDFTVNNPFTNNGGTVNFTGATIGTLGGEYVRAAGSLVGVPQATASAVPEPETYAMFLAGLGLMGFAGRRKATK